MEELKLEAQAQAPLAKFESDDFYDLCSDLKSYCDLKTDSVQRNKGLENLKKVLDVDEENNDLVTVGGDSNFMETFSGSLEDLVTNFDEKITKCFCNYDENTENLAPIQMRNQEELMTDSQFWTLTGNYGNILPIDWSTSYTRRLQLPALNLNEQQALTNAAMKEEAIESFSDEDEAIAHDLDMHSLILGRHHDPEPPVPSADEVLREIDFMMQDSPSECCSEGSDNCNCRNDKMKFSAPFYHEKLNDLSVGDLNEIVLESEALIKENSEVLINELALRDELEYEKELKNSFISHLLAVQKKRRQHNLDRKKNSNSKSGGEMSNGSSKESKYLTTVIPYHSGGPPINSTLQVLIKILKAIEQDSPAVPTLLTDYILKVLCPT